MACATSEKKLAEMKPMKRTVQVTALNSTK